ncbi:unnamed protein product [Anisakis simplex]|uniref:DEK_C domain-containing protein n=1 Tax=Anisakis simplex TaxID=6269 RepID=A0A0M3KK52_ANISI|nr:unnamed protein product [Anisakis simplex]
MATYRMPVEFVPVVIGACGEIMTELKEDLTRTLGLSEVKVKALLERQATEHSRNVTYQRELLSPTTSKLHLNIL